MLYPITDETALYMLRGSGTVGLGGEAVAQIGEGDVVAYPSGVLRGERDATVVLWKVVGTKPLAEVTPKVVRASEAGIRQLAYWPGQDGKRVVVTTPEAFAAAPPGAIKLEIKNYDFDGNAVGVTKNYKGGPTNKTTGQRDGLLYITSGKMRFFQDDVDVVVGPGDAVREAAGRYHNWIRLEDSSFVGIGTAPLATVTVENPNDYAGTARPSK
jgi:quercetin dioxygenase-like cupin family protein